jgi:hypothetical protein
VFKSCIGNSGGAHSRCPRCFPDTPSGTSGEERELRDFLRDSTGLAVLSKVRSVIKPYELDMYFQSTSLVIEFDGLFGTATRRLARMTETII